MVRDCRPFHVGRGGLASLAAGIILVQLWISRKWNPDESMDACSIAKAQYAEHLPPDSSLKLMGSDC